MIIGSEFSKKYHQFLKTIGELSDGDTSYRVPVKTISEKVNSDRTELKHVLEYLEALGFISIETIGGPFLYGHITITESGWDKYQELTK